MLAASSFNSELVFPPGFFEFNAAGFVGNMSEFASVPNPGLTPGELSVSRLIQTDQPVQFLFNWEVAGVFGHAFNPAFIWEVEVILEKYGPTEFDLVLAGVSPTQVTFGSGIFSPIPFPGTTTYAGVSVNIPANTITAGVYEAVAVIRLLHPDGVTPCFLAAFGEFGKIQFYGDH